MKPRNREVNIFNMSVLDLLTGALGAFSFLTLALFPFYFKFQRASAAVKGEEAAAAEALRGMNVKLESELANAKTSRHGMPPFAMAFLTMSGPKNSFCAFFGLPMPSAREAKPPSDCCPMALKRAATSI